MSDTDWIPGAARVAADAARHGPRTLPLAAATTGSGPVGADLPAIQPGPASRIRLRPWRDADRAPCAALNADAEVMRHFPARLDRAASDAAVDRWQALIAERGWGFWAAERIDRDPAGEFIGMIGLAIPRHAMPFSPCVEIGWRVAREHWHQGLATDGARLALAFGFDELRLSEIVSFTALANRSSRSVMERLGMRHDPADDFDHPAIKAGHALARHCLYRLRGG